jgi:hypothetical protein
VSASSACHLALFDMHLERSARPESFQSTVTCRPSGTYVCVDFVLRPTHLHENVMKRSQLLVRELLGLRIRQALISELRERSVHGPTCKFSSLSSCGPTERAVSTNAAQSSLGRKRRMKSRFSGASRTTSSTSEKTRGKLSFVQLPGVGVVSASIISVEIDRRGQKWTDGRHDAR